MDEEWTPVKAKSKQNAQRSAAKQPQVALQNNNQKQSVSVAAPIPIPQPTKSTGGKAHKKNEINQKGANKEGTDMDAFNDNAGGKEEDEEEVNFNVVTPSNPPVVSNNDIVNANVVLAVTETKNNVPQQMPHLDVNVNVDQPTSNNTKSESNEMTIKKPTAEILKTNKFSITDIVKEKPKNIKPYVSMVESQDEPDRVGAIPNDRLVQVKNDVNSKTSEINRFDNKLPYKEGQWSPANQNGVKVYQKDFLLALKDIPASKKLPDNIPDVVLADERGRLSDGRSSMGGRTDFAPSFNNYGSKSSSQRGAPPKRNSQSKMGPGGKLKPNVKVSISVREDVKLHETENAWRPARLNTGENATNDDKKTEELYKKVRGVLNKLTPQKFDTLLAQIKALQIDTSERLQGVIDLCFDKAVDEPNYSVAYALMCRELALMQVPTNTSTEEKPEYVNFRKLLITRCQSEFEKQSVDENTRSDKIKVIEESTDPEKKKDLQFELDEYDRRLRMKSVGNIRFIGELFKQKMLTVNIMMRCLNFLLDNKDEESLECLCKLLTTVGKELESNNVGLSSIFNQMKMLAENKKDTKVSSRIRFMIQDVIDLRSSKWVPRRQDLNPKTIDQIQKEAEHEQMNIHMMNSVPMTPRKDDRSNQGPPNSDRKGGRGGRNVSDDGWMTMNTNRNRTTPFMVQSDKLKSKAPTIDEPFGSSSLFGAWGKGSVGSNNNKTPGAGPNTANMYAALENMEPDKRNLNTRPGSKDPYHSKGPSLERNYNKYDGRGSRSGSQHRSNDHSASSSQRNTPAPIIPPVAIPKPVAQPLPVETPQLTEDQIMRRITNSLEEYISGNCTVDEYFTEITVDMLAGYLPRAISESYLYVLEKSQHLRLKTGSLFANLIKQGRIQLVDYSAGLKDILSQADDLKIDIPKIWDYLSELLVDLVCEEALPLKELFSYFLILIDQRQADKLLAPLFKLVVSKKGPDFLSSIWNKSGLQLREFVPNNSVDSFIADNQFEFLTGGTAPVGQNQLSYDNIQETLSKFLASVSKIDEISNWIMANVGDRVTENTFLRALATAVFKDSIDKKAKLNPDRLTSHTALLQKYIDNETNRETQCLYALQALIQEMEHPQGLLLQICDKLYELGSISQESFVLWETDTDPAEQEGKGVALKQLTSFFTQLKENDDDDVSGSGSDE